MEQQVSFTVETEQGEQPIAPLPPAATSNNPSTVLALIERLALDPHADVEKLERMMERTGPLYTKSTTESRKGEHAKHSNTPRWRRSTNICAPS